MFVNDLEKFLSYGQHPVVFLSSHDLIHISFEFDFKRSELCEQPGFIRNLRNINETDFLTHLSGHDWMSIYSEIDINVKVHNLILFFN